MHVRQVTKDSTRGLYFWIIKRTRPSPLQRRHTDDRLRFGGFTTIARSLSVPPRCHFKGRVFDMRFVPVIALLGTACGLAAVYAAGPAVISDAAGAAAQKAARAYESTQRLL